jgi:ribose 5-phosphate isomerase RpiB
MIANGCHHGVELKDFLVGFFRAKGVEVRDFGTHGQGSVDYPDFGREVSLRVSQEGDRRRVDKITRIEHDPSVQITRSIKN